MCTEDYDSLAASDNANTTIDLEILQYFEDVDNKCFRIREYVVIM